MSATVDAAHGTIAIPEATGREATPVEQCDRAIAQVHANKDLWKAVGLLERADLCDRMVDDVMAVAEDWARAAQLAKGINRDSLHRNEDYVSGPVVILRNLRLLAASLRALHESSSTHHTGHGDVRELRTGQLAVQVFPTTPLDNLTFAGFTAETVMQRGITREDLPDHVAVAYREEAKARPGRVCAVLGAGNVSSIGPMDALYKLFVEDEVVVLKMNPVNDYTGPFVERGLAALVERGVLRVVHGGVEVGKHLTNHEMVDTLHLTGSDKTYDAVVFGTGAEGARRKAADEPVNTKDFSAELGNVTPVIVVPGRWSDKDLRFQAMNIASMLANNGGFNCIAARMIVTHKHWKQRERLLIEVAGALKRIEERHPYYPGARQRFEAFTAAHPDAWTLGRDADDAVPWTLIRDLDPTDRDDIAFTTEAFCGVFGEVALDAPRDVDAYLRQAVLFCNETLWGQLGATVIVDPRTEERHRDAFERALLDLRYGSVTVNHFSAVPYAMVSPTWGAFPGNDRTAIGSGVGVVHNTYMLDGVEKSIARGPFRMPIKPVWFADHRTGADLAQDVARLEGKGDLTVLPRLLVRAARG